jgi:fructokinase
VPDYQGLVDRWAKVADVIKASDFDIQTAYPGKSIRDVAARWLENGASLAVVTFGNRGSWALRLENGRLKEYHIPCETPLEAPFTVGAGDSFNAGLCLELFKGSDLLMMRRGEYVHGSINAALRAGNSSASLHLKENGAYPRPAESRSADGIEPTPVLQMPPRLPNLIDYAPDPRPSRSIQP